MFHVVTVHCPCCKHTRAFLGVVGEAEYKCEHCGQIVEIDISQTDVGDYLRNYSFVNG